MGGAATFLLAFSALFSIVNPFGGAFIFNEVTAHLTRADRTRLAGKVAFFALLVMLGSLWGGAYVLNFFGISLSALRLAGGAIVAIQAFELLTGPEKREVRKQEQAVSGGGDVDAIAFFPLTLPFTTGPGTIAATIALGTGSPFASAEPALAQLGALLASVAISALIYLCYRFADRTESLLGRTLTDALMRLFALLLMCVGIEIIWHGLAEMAQISR